MERTVGAVRVRFPGRRDREPRSDGFGARSPCVAEVQVDGDSDSWRPVPVTCCDAGSSSAGSSSAGSSVVIANVTKVRCAWSETDLHKTNGLSTPRRRGRALRGDWAGGSGRHGHYGRHGRHGRHGCYGRHGRDEGGRGGGDEAHADGVTTRARAFSTRGADFFKSIVTGNALPGNALATSRNREGPRVLTRFLLARSSVAAFAQSNAAQVPPTRIALTGAVPGHTSRPHTAGTRR